MMKWFKTILLSSIVLALILVGCSKDDDSTPKDEENNYAFETGSFTDSRDGNVYKTVTIGAQTWMAENLAYLPDSGYYAYTADSLVEKYGYLYDWETANKVSPEGWHLPSQDEWDQLEIFLTDNGYSYDGVVGNKFIAKSLASKNGWKEFTEYDILEGRVGGKDNPNIQNKTGFTALPGGFYSGGLNSTIGIGEEVNWWTSNDSTLTTIQVQYATTLYYDFKYVFNSSFSGSNFLSIRCVKD